MSTTFTNERAPEGAPLYLLVFGCVLDASAAPRATGPGCFGSRPRTKPRSYRDVCVRTPPRIDAAGAADRFFGSQAAGIVGFELQQLANLSQCSSSAIGNEVFSTFAMARFFGGENKKPGSQRGSGRDTPHCISDHTPYFLKKFFVDLSARWPRLRRPLPMAGFSGGQKRKAPPAVIID
jgi:hypothetical protein